MSSKSKEIFLKFGSKLVSDVDLPGKGSHQHEIGVPKKCRQVFEPGELGLSFADFYFLSGKSSTKKENIDTFYYNVRQGKPRPPEFRLYYSQEIDAQFSGFSKGDLCVYLKTINHKIIVIITNKSSSYFREISELFGSNRKGTEMFTSVFLSSSLCKLLRLDTNYFVHDLENFDYQQQEQIGSKDKGWYSPKKFPNRLYLFKKPNRKSGEPWAEKVAFELSSILGINAAKIHLCKDRDNEYGSLSLSFIPLLLNYKERKQLAFKEFRSPELTLGNELMTALYGKKYSDIVLTRKNPHYTLENIYKVFVQNNWQHLWPNFLEYIYFDCLIGNSDRHHENWGFIRYPKKQKEEETYFLAPSYDHGPAFDSGSNDSKRAGIISSGSIEAHYRKCPTAFHLNNGSKATIPDLITECTKIDRKTNGNMPVGLQFAEKLRYLTNDQVSTILSQIPDHVMTSIEKDFTFQYIVTAKQIIMEIIENEL